MKVIGIYWGICSTVALWQDDQIVAAVSEERFTRVKNDNSFPKNSINWIMRTFSLKIEDIDNIAISSFIQKLPHYVLKQHAWSVQDYLKEQHEIWYPTLYENKEVTHLDVFASKIDRNMYPHDYWEKDVEGLKKQDERFPRDREGICAQFFGISSQKIKRIYHPRAHAYYAYYSSPFRGEDVLALTIDGWGDDSNATISIFDSDGKYKMAHRTKEASIGRIYRYITLLLGMKPNEHEYKVMGLAPYGKAEIAAKALKIFRSTLYVDGIDFKWNEKPTDSYFWFKERLEGCRFDGIAAALQQWTEELITKWVKNTVKHFKISTVVLSGGVSMNVKANALVAELPEVKKMFVGGSGSDESTAISSAICLAQDVSEKNGVQWDCASVPYMEKLYLGPCAKRVEEEKAIESLDRDKYLIHDKVIHEEIIELLVQGKVVARCVGYMEFGQRSLGNRSILADPINPDIIGRINLAIKNRDFWMPFAPVVLDSFIDRYLINPKNILSPHMTLAYKTTKEGWLSMRSGCHPADRTARAQILTKNANPDFYDLLKKFSLVTGRGALLNTSFNLHGYPIVNTPDQAIDVLEKSGLDALILNHYLVLKK